MKKLLVVMLVLTMASVANAALWISVDGVVNPPDTSVTLNVSDTAIIDIYGDGLTPGGVYYLGVHYLWPDGPRDNGTLNIDSAVILYTGNQTHMLWNDLPEAAAYYGMENPLIEILLDDLREPGDTNPLVPLSGKLVDNIIFHCDSPHDVLLILGNGVGEQMDVQVIHQPEPMTMALLGLGGLFLRRRK